MNDKYDCLCFMMNVAWSCLEDNVLIDGDYVKDFLTCTQWMNEWMNEANENIMNMGLLKCFSQ